MQDVDLFQLALALMPPWQVVESRFEGERKRLDLRIDFTAGSRFACPGCGRAGCGVHDVEKKTWRHLNFFQHEAYLEAYLQARVPRVRCPECGVRWLTVPWARPGSGFTVLFEAFVLTLVKHLPVNAVAALVGETDQRLWRIVHHYVEMARAQVDMTQVRQVGILNWFQSDLANGLLEGINSLIQAAKAKARGYRSDRNLIAMIYLIAGKLGALANAEGGTSAWSSEPPSPTRNDEEPNFLPNVGMLASIDALAGGKRRTKERHDER